MKDTTSFDNTSVRRSSKLMSCETQNDQEELEKSIKGSGSLPPQKEALKLHLNDNEKQSCSDTSISSVELEDLPWQQNSLGTVYRQLSLLKSTPMPKQSYDRTSQMSQSTQISETTTPHQENSTSSQWASPAQVRVMQEIERVSSILHPHCGEKDLDVSLRLNPNSVLSNNLKELSDEDFELFLEDSDWQDTLGKLKQSRRRSLEQDTRGSDCLSFPTLTSNENSTTRPAGQTKCERWFKNKGLIPNGSQLGSQAIATIMGFPPNWFDCLLSSDVQSTAIAESDCLSPTEPQEELEVDISQVGQLPQDRQPSPSKESSTSQKLLGDKLSIPCLIKQPHKKPMTGFIVGDRGSKFDVKVDDRVIQLPKLYVFPNFPSPKKCKTDDDISPSKNSRRKKGMGSGYINWRVTKKNGKNYKQTWFHYELWDKGRQVKSCVYIPKKMRSQIQKMNAEKIPVEDILEVLRNRRNKK